MRTIKVPLILFVKDIKHIDTIEQCVQNCHKLRMHACFFLKLFFLNYFEKHKKMCHFSPDVVCFVLKLVSNDPKFKQRKEGGGRKQKKPLTEEQQAQKKQKKQDKKDICEQMRAFYCDNYKHLTDNEVVDYSGLGNTLNYMATEIFTAYSNNIIAHFYKYVCRAVNVYFEKDAVLASLNNEQDKQVKEKAKKEFFAKLKKTKKHVWDLQYEDDDFDVLFLKSLCLPRIDFTRFRTKASPEAKPIGYFLKTDTFEFMLRMFYICSFVERKGKKAYNLFPMTLSNIPGHIKFDTLTISRLFYPGLEQDVSANQNLIWNDFANLKTRVFKTKSLLFNNMITTDGFSCGIIMKGANEHDDADETAKIVEFYIDELCEGYLVDYFYQRRLVTIDPNKRDLMYCASAKDVPFQPENFLKNFDVLRYTQDARRRMCNVKKHRKLLEKEKKQAGITEHEARLSAYNHKALNTQSYLDFLHAKMLCNNLTGTFYRQLIFRQRNMAGFQLKKKFDAQFLKKFKRKFGRPKDVVIGFGDWNQKGLTKFHEPTKGMSLRKMLRRAGYSVFLIDEFRTSARCSACGGELKTFLKRKNPRPYKDNVIKVHGLLRCDTCKKMFNRDFNSCLNLMQICYAVIDNQPRPAHLRRATVGGGDDEGEGGGGGAAQEQQRRGRKRTREQGKRTREQGKDVANAPKASRKRRSSPLKDDRSQKKIIYSMAGASAN